MDTKTPPIPLKIPEKIQQKKQERIPDVSLPPLTPYHNHRSKQKPNVTSSWSRDTPSCTFRYQEHQKKRPYRVLHIGATPLMYACQQADRPRVIRLLKEQEDTIGYRDRTLRTALHYCMDAGTGGAVAAAAPELVNAPDAEGHTPLHLAVIAGDTQLVAVLLANGADVNAKDLEGHSVLHWATVCGEAECVRLVLAAGARPSTPDLRGGSPLHYAAQCCGAAATAELAVPKKVGLKVLQTLLEFGADVNAKDEDGRQPILWAASAGSVEAVLALARAGGAAAAGASDKDGLTALHCAASRGHARCIEALVNLCGSQPDHVDDNGCSALHYAATLGHADATALILKLGADPNRQDRKGRTPALCAAAKGQLETLKILAQHGGSLQARTVRGTGVAHEAVASGRIELIKWLAKKRPSTLDIATHDGKTPLHIAALHGHLDVCKVLLDNGARINAVLRTSKGNLMTPLDAALYRGHRDCAKLIQLHGGTTAQNLKTQKPASNKVFAAKIRLRHTDSSMDSDSSSRERSRSYRPPELYYEERWIERRTRRRGSLRKLARRDSRSFSEEEVRLSKTSSMKDPHRRARSESARYDDGDSTDRKLKKKRSRKRISKYRHDYSESSMDSDSCDQAEGTKESGSIKTTLRQSTEKRRSKSSEDKEKSNGTERRECSKRVEDERDDDESVSDDSLEVVVVKRSLEKKSEKVISGRRSKTPRESSREMKLTKSHRRTRRKSKSSRSRTPDNEEDAPERTQSSSDKGKSSKETNSQETPRSLINEEKGNQESVVETRYRKDVTDSTSQETVERVVVTALVHKDQGPDTPKSMLETSKGVTFDDKLQTDLVEIESGVKSDKETAEVEVGRSKRKGSKDDVGKDGKAREEKDTEKKDVEMGEEGRLEVHESTETESPSLDSQKGYDRLKSHQDDSASKLEKALSTSTEISEREAQQKDLKSFRGSEESQGQAESSSFSEQKESDTLRTAVENVSVSECEDNKSTEQETQKTRSRPQTSKSKVSGDGKRSMSSSEDSKSKSSSSKRSDSHASSGSPKRGSGSPKRGSGSPKRGSDTRRKRESMKRRESSARRVSIKSNDEKSEGKAEAIEIQKQEASPESPDDKEQVDSARGKSVDLSSESRDSALMEDGDVESLRTDTPVAIQGNVIDGDQTAEESSPRKSEADREDTKEYTQKDESKKGRKSSMEDAIRMGDESFRYIDESSSSSPKSPQTKQSRPTTAKARGSGRSSSKSPAKRSLFESSEERSPDRSAIVAVIESPEWDEEDEALEKEIRDAIGEDTEHNTEQDNNLGVLRVLPSTSEEETPRTGATLSRTSANDILPQVQSSARTRSTRAQSPQDSKQSRLRMKQRRDSCGRDSGIEPSPRVSRIPRRRSLKCCPNTEKQQALNMETVTKDVQINLRRYHLERKIFFQLMELKRLQIRHGRANEHVLVKRQVEAFNRSGMSGPTLGVAKYNQPLTFRDFEAFLYEQLRKLQRRPATPDFCTDAKQCTRRTHRCHHATSAYTSAPVYTYLGGGAPERADLLPKIESRGKGQMTVEVTHGEEKQVIALPAERLDRTKRYFVTFTVRGECQETEKPKSSNAAQRNAKSV